MTGFETSLIIVCACIITISVISGTILKIVLDHKLKERVRAVYYYKWCNLYRQLGDILRDSKLTDSEKCLQIKGYMRYDN